MGRLSPPAHEIELGSKHGCYHLKICSRAASPKDEHLRVLEPQPATRRLWVYSGDFQTILLNSTIQTLANCHNLTVGAKYHYHHCTEWTFKTGLGDMTEAMERIMMRTQEFLVYMRACLH